MMGLGKVKQKEICLKEYIYVIIHKYFLDIHNISNFFWGSIQLLNFKSIVQGEGEWSKQIWLDFSWMISLRGPLYIFGNKATDG